MSLRAIDNTRQMHRSSFKLHNAHSQLFTVAQLLFALALSSFALIFSNFMPSQSVCNCISYASLACISSSSFLGLSAVLFNFLWAVTATPRAVLSQITPPPALLRCRCNKRVHLFQINQSNQFSSLFLFFLSGCIDSSQSSACSLNPFHIFLSWARILVYGKEEKKQPMISGVRTVFFPFFIRFCCCCPFLLHSVTRRLASAHSCCMWYTASTLTCIQT
jgi:hypothetical protein